MYERKEAFLKSTRIRIENSDRPALVIGNVRVCQLLALLSASLVDAPPANG